jgi:uncharacterized protein (TIGR03067 family)
MRTAVALLVAAAVAVAAPVPKQLKKQRPDAEVFVGTWELVVAEQHGQPAPKAVWTFDSELKMTSRPLDPKETWSSDWVTRIDPEKSPKEIDIGKEYKGIYEIDGDEIRIAYTGGTRPSSFDSKAKMFYTVLRRTKGDGK